MTFTGMDGAPNQGNVILFLLNEYKLRRQFFAQGSAQIK